MERILKKYWVVILSVILGAVGGYIYWKLVGCSSGGCAITASPINSTFYGAIIGWLLGNVLRKKDKDENEKANFSCPICVFFSKIWKLTSTHKQDEKEGNMKIIELNKTMFLEKIANFEASPKEWKYLGEKPALIDFYAPWCGPCKGLAPILEDLAAEYGDEILIYKVNTDTEQELAQEFGIRSIPSLLFVPMNGDTKMVAGAMGKADLKKAIDELLIN